MSMWTDIAARIAEATGAAFTVAGRRSVGGGCINDAAVLESDDGRRVFVKLNSAARQSMFEAEAEGLREIARTRSVRVPEPIVSGTTGESAFLVLEYLPLHGDRARAAEALGAQLARLHLTSAARFGWYRDNTIGSTPQLNGWSEDWVGFWRDRRLGFQLALARQNHHGGSLLRKGERLLADLGHFFAGYTPRPSLLHGDLWGGNYAATDDGQPVIFDPAVYFGDREADIAMTELFGGFRDGFYRAYREAYPLDAGYAVRRTLYNLYHVLNHLNLFGGAYASQAEAMIDTLLREIR